MGGGIHEGSNNNASNKLFTQEKQGIYHPLPDVPSRPLPNQNDEGISVYNDPNNPDGAETSNLVNNKSYHGIEGNQQNDQYPALDSAEPSLLAKICSFFWWTGKGAKVEPRGDESNIGEVKNEKSDEAESARPSEKPAPVAQPKTSWWNPFSWITSGWFGKGATAENQDHGGIEEDESFVAIKEDILSPLGRRAIKAGDELMGDNLLADQPPYFKDFSTESLALKQ